MREARHKDEDTLKNAKSGLPAWDHSSHEKFFEYYAKESQSPETLGRLRSIRDAVVRVWEERRQDATPLEVADIGCGAGTQCLLWAELGHRVHGLDVNEPLLQLASERAASAGRVIDFQIGTAVELPWADTSMDICLTLELLEHVADWGRCLSECARILRPGGILVLTTTNFLCPIQQEFNLPLYSWYPGLIKRQVESLAQTSRPDLANYAKYPAVNWFSFYSLRALLRRDGFHCLDRFDVIDVSSKSGPARWVVTSIRRVPMLRWLAHLGTSGTMVFAVKERGTSL